MQKQDDELWLVVSCFFLFSLFTIILNSQVSLVMV